MVLFDKLSFQFAATANKKGILFSVDCSMDGYVTSLVRSFFQHFFHWVFLMMLVVSGLFSLAEVWVDTLEV